MEMWFYNYQPISVSIQHVSGIPVQRHLSDQPVHARQVAPEVAGTVGSGHLLGIDHHRVALRGGRAGLS